MRTVLYVNATGAISGAERSLLTLLDALDRRRWLPVVVAPEGALLREVADRGIAVHPVSLTPFSRPHSLRQGMSALRALRAGRHAVSDTVRQVRPDLVHANSTSAMLYSAHISPTPVIWQVRDLVPLGTVGALLYRRAACVAAISSAVRDDLLQYACEGGRKITLLPPAVDTDRFQPVSDRRALRARLGLPQELPLIGLVAQFVPWKRHHLFLDALSLMADRPWQAVLAGANLHDDPDYPASLQARIATPPLAGRVSILPWQEDPTSLMAALDLCVLTSKREPFGRALIEAMACGVPTVAVNEGGATDIILPEETGLLTEAEPTALASAMSRLLDDAGLRERFARAGRDRAVACFSINHQREMLAELYGGILGSVL